MKLLIAWVTGVLLTCGSWLALAADIPDPALKARLEKIHGERDAIFAEFAAAMSNCLNRPGENHAAFKGCGNWVQSVQSTWGLVAYSGLTKDVRYVPQVDGILTGQKIRREWQRLQNEKGTEFPYGRAWLLRLSVDHFRVFDNQLTVPMGDWLAQDMVERYRQLPPDSKRRDQLADSFGLLMTYIYLVERDNKVLSAFTSELIRQGFLSYQGACDINKEGTEWQETLPYCTTWAVAVTRGLQKEEYERWIQGFLPPLDQIVPVSNPTSPKQENVNFMRAALFWRLYERTNRMDYLKLYVDHFEAGYARKAWTKTDGLHDQVAPYGVLAIAPVYYINHPVSQGKSERS